MLDQHVEFQPIRGKIVIEITNTEAKYGSLILPQRSMETRTIGTVYAVYEPFTSGHDLVEPQVEIGDKVIFGKFGGTNLAIGRRHFIVMREQDLLCVFTTLDEDMPLDGLGVEE